MSYHDPILPAPAPQSRADGWSPALQRRFLETLAETGIVRLAGESCRLTARSAYHLRVRRDGAAFRLGWDAAILIARARLADDLLARAILGCEETIRKDEENFQVTRHRHDNRLAMSMLARLDRMADCPAEGSDAALARVVAQDFAAFLDLICPADQMTAEADRRGLPVRGAEPMARQMDDARLYDGAIPEPLPPLDEAAADLSTALSPGASAALFVAARMALHAAANGAADYDDDDAEEEDEEDMDPQEFAPQGQCELSDSVVDLADLPPEEAAARLEGIWWDEKKKRLRTDYPPPPGFDGEQSIAVYDIDYYERDLTLEEEEAYAARLAEERRPYEEAATRARDAFFGFVQADDEEDEREMDDDPA
jgi:hypothetical protein